MLPVDEDDGAALSSLGVPSQLPSQHSTRPPSASHARSGAACGAPSAGASLRPLSADGEGGRTPPSITPLDGGGGPGLSTDFHLGVVPAGIVPGGVNAVSWQPR